MPEELASKLLTLTRWLVGSIDNIGSASNFAEIYQEFRHVFFANSLEALYKAAKEQEQLFSNRSARYEKGSTILLKYYQHLAWILQVKKNDQCYLKTDLI